MVTVKMLTKRVILRIPPQLLVACLNLWPCALDKSVESRAMTGLPKIYSYFFDIKQSNWQYRRQRTMHCDGSGMLQAPVAPAWPSVSHR